MSPDLSFTVRPADYLAALDVDSQRWTSDAAPRWDGRRVWILRQGIEQRTMWRLKAFDGERFYSRTFRPTVKSENDVGNPTHP